MKQVHASYSFVASTKTITLTGLNIDQDQLLLIVNATRGVQYFNFADSSLRAAVTPGSNTSVVLTDASTTGHANGDALVIYYDDQVTSQVVSGTVTANPGTGAFTVSGTVGLDNASLVALENITVTVGSSVALAAGSAQVGSVTVSNFPATQTISGTVTANNEHLSSNQDGGGFPVLRSGVYAYDYGNDIQVGVAVLNPETSFPALNIGGTVTASVVALGQDGPFPVEGNDQWGAIYAQIGNNVGVINSSNPLNITGTVTVGNSVTIGSLPAISGTVTANAILQNATAMAQAFIDESNAYGSVSVVLSGSAGDIGVAGTVTAAAPNGSLTTRFGTPTTANTAFATAAVTKSDRKYLLIQNVTTGSNVITVGIGFTPTTTQGIQLTAGAGITFESSYIPTGAVYVLSSVTASNFTILEA